MEGQSRKRKADGPPEGAPEAKKQNTNKKQRKKQDKQSHVQNPSKYPAKRKAELPSRGKKLMAWTGSEKDHETLGLKVNEWYDALNGERGQIERNMGSAVWRPDLAQAEVLVQRTKFFESMGYSLDGTLMLFPEEAVLLVERGVMELFYNDVALSLSECYALLSACGISLDSYYVYAYMRRQGYIVTRVHQYTTPEQLRTAATEQFTAYETARNKASAAPAEDAVSHAETAPAPTSFWGTAWSWLSNAVSKFTPWRARPTPALAQTLLPGTNVRGRDQVFAALRHPLQAGMLDHCTPNLVEAPPVQANNVDNNIFALDYEVFKAQKSFRKTTPGLPLFRVSVCSFGLPPPALRVFERLTVASYPVPVKFGIVEGSTVNFFGFLDVHLPDVTRGAATFDDNYHTEKNKPAAKAPAAAKASNQETEPTAMEVDSTVAAPPAPQEDNGAGVGFGSPAS